MTERIVRGETVGASPISSKPETEIDPIDGMAMELIDRAVDRYRGYIKFWGFLALVMLVFGLTRHEQWAWISLAINGGFMLLNCLGLVVVSTDSYHAYTRRTIIARGRYRQAGGR